MLREIVLKSFNPYEVVKAIANVFKTPVEEEFVEKRVTIPRSAGEGFVAGLDFKDGLGMLVFNCRFKHDLILRYVTDDYQPLRLIFCMENDFTHIIKGDRMQYQLNNFLGSMVSGTCKNEQIFLLPAEKQIYYYSIEIDRKKYNPKIARALLSLPEELKEIFHDTECMRSFLYQGNYSLTIAECITNISKTEHKGLVRRVYIESKTLEIMALQVKQYLDDLEPSKRQTVFRKKDIEQIMEARNILLKHIEKAPTIKELARLAGTNETKLKQGFRRLYNLSINKVLQDERLNKAKLLLAEELYSVKEVAKMIGYKHAGHFTAKFKEKFGVLPKDYLLSLKRDT